MRSKRITSSFPPTFLRASDVPGSLPKREIERVAPGEQPFQRTSQHAYTRRPFPCSTGNIIGKSGMGHVRGKVEIGVQIDPALDEWIEDRAAILDVKKTHLIRDVLALYAKLVMEAEAEADIDYGVRNAKIALPERSDGYTAALKPGGFSKTHLDDSPLGLEEINEL